jgi:hypothetical protein
MRASTPRDSYALDKPSDDALAFPHTLLEGSNFLILPVRKALVGNTDQGFFDARSLFFNNVDCVN